MLSRDQIETLLLIRKRKGTVLYNTRTPKPISPLQDALEDLRKHFAPREINSGMHFNYATLLKAFKVYEQEFDTLKKSGNDDDKCDLFWRQVIGYIQRGLPACDRQAFAQGIYYVIKDKEKLQRHFNFRCGGGSFPLTSSGDSHSGLGFEYAGHGAGGRWLAAAGATWGGTGRCFQNLCQTKTTNLQHLCDHISQRRLCV